MELILFAPSAEDFISYLNLTLSIYCNFFLSVPDFSKIMHPLAPYLFRKSFICSTFSIVKYYKYFLNLSFKDSKVRP